MENINNNGVTEENGKVNISDEVIAIIASKEAAAVKGVANMAGTVAGGFAELLGKKNNSKGVKVTRTETDIAVDLSIVVEYDTNIPNVAWEVQDKVKSEIELMTGMNVSAVNISVDGITAPALEKKDTAEEVEKSKD